MPRAKSMIIAPALSLLFVPLSIARTITVDPNGGGSFTDVQPAIDAAIQGDTVLVMPGTYRVTQSITFRGKAITVKADRGPEETTIDMGFTHRPVVTFDNGETKAAVLDGFTLTAGSRGIYCPHGSPTVSNCHISRNAAGGAFFGYDSSPVLINCGISTNWDPGVDCDNGSSPNLINCTISDNYGGGVSCLFGSAPTLTNCTVSGNSYSGVRCDPNSSPSLTHCTISGNSAFGLLCRFGSSSPRLMNCIVWDNGDSLSIAEGALPVVSYSCLEGAQVYPGAGNINVDPLFCGWETPEVLADDQKGFEDALGRFNLALSSASPCLGKGEEGVNMGADLGVCAAASSRPERLIRLAPGFYSIRRNLLHKVSLEGAGDDQTVLWMYGEYVGDIGSVVKGLKSGTVLARLMVKGDQIVLSSGSAEFRNCTIQSSITCHGDSSPTLTDCTLSGLSCNGASAPSLTNCIISGGGTGVDCSGDSTPSLIGCTVAGNPGGGIRSSGSSRPVIKNSIVWNNRGEAMAVTQDSVPQVSFSCLETEILWPGPGNINRDPLFCGGWGASQEVYVDGAASVGGDGTPEHPYPDLNAATNSYEFSIALTNDSPCLGTGEGGLDMGAATGRCEGPGEKARLIHLAAGTYSASGLNLVDRVSLEGAGEGQTIIKGTLSGLRTGAILSHLTVTGEIQVSRGEAPEIRDCTIHGGVACIGGAPFLTNCTISGNSGEQIHCSGSSSLVLSNCTISGNSASAGAGIFSEDSSLVLNGCTISGNSGGGIVCDSLSSLRLTDCTIAGNTGGGGWVSWSSSVELFYCTVSGNSPGGLVFPQPSSPLIRDCILWGNHGPSLSLPEGSNPRVGHSCIQSDLPFPGTDNSNSDPLFCGWGPAGEVYVDVSQSDPGTGTPDHPYSSIAPALEYRLSLSLKSPCLGTAEGGRNRGADLGICDAWGSPTRLVHLAPGSYDLGGLVLGPATPSFEGAGEENTVIVDTVRGLGTGATVSHLTVTGGTAGGIIVDPGASPGIHHCTITGNQAGGVICGPGSSPVLTNCTIIGNSASGVVCGSNSSPVLTHCWISGNKGSVKAGGGNVFRPTYGGGVACFAASPTLMDCTIVDNEATSGGGVYCVGDFVPTLDRCTITGNSSIYGGGIFCEGSSPNLSHCVLAQNRSGTGGAVFCQAQSLATFDGCTITGNLSSSRGGGLFCEDSSPIMTNCIIAGNSGDSGAGLNCWESSSPKLINCTITANNGPEVVCQNRSSPIFRNCIVWDNGDGLIAIDDASQPSVDHSCVEGDALGWGEGNTDSDPLFLNPGVYDFNRFLDGTCCSPDFVVEVPDYRLLPGSSCRDTGTAEGAPAVDLLGNRRPCGAGVDMGAYEFGGCGDSIRFHRGDPDSSGTIDISDGIAILGFLFLGDPADFSCQESADADNSGTIDISDGISLLNWLLLDGPEPAAPGPTGRTCGFDPDLPGSTGDLGCKLYGGCR